MRRSWWTNTFKGAWGTTLQIPPQYTVNLKTQELKNQASLKLLLSQSNVMWRFLLISTPQPSFRTSCKFFLQIYHLRDLVPTLHTYRELKHIFPDLLIKLRFWNNSDKLVSPDQTNLLLVSIIIKDEFNTPWLSTWLPGLVLFSLESFFADISSYF